jgi:anti-sigma regulatory factor (Ser/Thr protein kinase)
MFMQKITVPAKIENLDKVLNFVNKQLSSVDYNMKARLQLELSVEEAYINISKYAYESEVGKVEICCTMEEDPLQIKIRFIDSGIPYNPLENEDPDIYLGTEEKMPGGLGIFLIKKNVNNIGYEYQNGKNILTIQKKLND